MKQLLPEPKGARMQVVKGFSALLWRWLHPSLPTRVTKNPRRQQRTEITCYWPKWCGDHWYFKFEVDDRTVAYGTIYPTGKTELCLCERNVAQNKAITHTFERSCAALDLTPILLFEQYAYRYTPDLLEHLIKCSKVPRSVSGDEFEYPTPVEI